MLLAAQRSWLHTLALPKHALCWRVSCEQPRHLGIYSRHRASTHSDKRVFARLAALLPKPTPGEPLRGLRLLSCSHLAVSAPQHFSEISTATHLPPTMLLVNPAQQHTHTKRERKKKEKTFYLTPHSLCADPRTSTDPGQEAGRCLVRAAGCGSEQADLGKHRMLVGLREQPRAAGLAPVSWEQPRWCGRAGPGACTDSQLLSADFRAAVPSGPWFSHSSNDPTAS